MTSQTILGPEKPLIDALRNKMGDVARTKADFNVFDALLEMRQLLINDMLERLRSGTATHQELAIMARMLKENGLVLMPIEEPAPIQEMQPIGFHSVHTALPEFDDGEEGEIDNEIELSPPEHREAQESELD